MAAIWTTHRERGHPSALRTFTWIALRLGRPVARLLLIPIVCYFVVAGGEARAASRDYLRRVLGRARLVDVFRHVHCFASVILDRLYLLNGRHELFDIEVEGSDAILGALGNAPDGERRLRRGAIVLGAHFGSFEAVRAAGRGESGLRVSMVMYEDNAQYLNEVLAAINPALDEAIIPLGRVDSMLRVKRALDDGGLVGMLADRILVEEIGTPAVREVTLLGGRASIPTGPFRMAAMLRRPVVFIAGVQRGGNRYAVHYEALYDFSVEAGSGAAAGALSTADAVDAAIDRYVARLEHYCRAAPFNWFNFYDFWNQGPAAAHGSAGGESGASKPGAPS